MPDLDEIDEIDDGLFIGAYWPRINFKKLKEQGVKAIVNLMEENYYTPPKRAFKYLHKGFPDESSIPNGYIEEVISFIEDNIQQGNVLVHCAMGISRSGGLCSAWLLKKHPEWTWNDAVEHIRKNHPIYPAEEIKESILDYFEKLEGRRR